MNSLPRDITTPAVHPSGNPPEQFGLQDVVQVQRLLPMALHQAVRAVAAAEAEQAGRVDQQHQVAQEPGGVEGLHA
jgi:hypothetical protein